VIFPESGGPLTSIQPPAAVNAVPLAGFIAKDQRLANHCAQMPPNWRTLYELTTLDDGGAVLLLLAIEPMRSARVTRPSRGRDAMAAMWVLAIERGGGYLLMPRRVRNVCGAGTIKPRHKSQGSQARRQGHHPRGHRGDQPAQTCVTMAAGHIHPINLGRLTALTPATALTRLRPCRAQKDG
jgi:hypothetical protein